MSKNYRKSRLLQPEAYDAMTKFKLECAKDIGRLQYCKENNDHYKGDVPLKSTAAKADRLAERW